MRRRAVIVLVLGLVALPAFLLQPALMLRVTTADGTKVICSRVVPGTAIILEFTHSMYGGFVRETYRIGDDGDLERQRIVTANAAAAEYYASDGRTRHIEGGYEVLGAPFTTDNLVVRVDDRGGHRLIVGATSHRLVEILPESTQIRIGVERTRPAVLASCT